MEAELKILKKENKGSLIEINKNVNLIIAKAKLKQILKYGLRPI